MRWEGKNREADTVDKIGKEVKMSEKERVKEVVPILVILRM